MKLKRTLCFLFYMLLGGVAFWTLDILIHARRAYEFSGRDVAVITLLLPWALLTCYGIVFWLRGRQNIVPSIAIPMLIGVWLLGSTAMMMGASYSGGGFATSGIDAWYFVSILPPYTFIMATYDGSLGGLLIANVLMILMYFRYERDHWIAIRLKDLWRSLST